MPLKSLPYHILLIVCRFSVDVTVGYRRIWDWFRQWHVVVPQTLFLAHCLPGSGTIKTLSQLSSPLPC